MSDVEQVNLENVSDEELEQELKETKEVDEDKPDPGSASW